MLRKRLLDAFSILAIVVTLWWVADNLFSFAHTGLIKSTWGEIANIAIVWLLIAVDLWEKKHA